MYEIREGIVCRDIGGIFFALDIHDKYLYRNHKLITLNSSGYKFMQIICKVHQFNEEELFNQLKNIFYNDITLNKDIVMQDIKKMLEILKQLGWVYVV